MISSLLRVVERDMAPSLIVFFFVMMTGTYYVIATILTFIFFACSGILVVAHARKNFKLIMFMRILIFVFTLLGFINLFVDSMTFYSLK